MSTQANLNGLRVLVTRPSPQGEILCDKIRTYGGEAFFFPTIEIIPSVDITTLKQTLSHLDLYDWIIFISPQAVYQAAPYISSIKSKVATVGAGTANVLREAKLPVDVYPRDEWNSEGLLDLPEFQNIQGKKIAIIKGEGGREYLAEELTHREAEVTPIIAYRRALPACHVDKYLDMLHREAIDVIICTSAEGLQNLKILLNAAWPSLQKTSILVISAAMQARAKELGFEKILLAKNASHDAILEAIEGRRPLDCS